jgi:hypothetical protein
MVVLKISWCGIRPRSAARSGPRTYGGGDRELPSDPMRIYWEAVGVLSDRGAKGAGRPPWPPCLRSPAPSQIRILSMVIFATVKGYS